MSGLLDYFTGVDDQIEQLSNTVDALRDDIGAIPSALDSQQAGLESLADELGASDNIFSRREGVFPMSAEVPPDTSRIGDDYYTEFDAPYDCVVSRVIVEANPSAQAGLGVQIGRSDGSGIWIPSGGDGRVVGGERDEPDMLSIPTSTTEFNPGVEVDKGSPIRAQYANNDATESHFAVVIVVLERRGAA